MKLDDNKIRNFFAVFTDMPDGELPRWNGLCDSAGKQIAGRLRENADIERNMERLCIAAAAVAYCNYTLLQSGAGADEIRVGDISLKNSRGNTDAIDAIGTREYFLADIADLVSASADFPVSCAECRI